MRYEMDCDNALNTMEVFSFIIACEVWIPTIIPYSGNIKKPSLDLFKEAPM